MRIKGLFIYDDELDNLIDWRDKDDFKTLLEDESKRILLGDCLLSDEF